MRLLRKSLFIAAMGLCLFLSGCKKNVSDSNTVAAPSNTAAAPEIDATQVDLRQYIPDDAIAAYVTTDKLDVTDASLDLVNSILTGLIKANSDSYKVSKKQTQNADDTSQDVKDRIERLHDFELLLEELPKVFQNYRENAAEWGLDPNGHFKSSFVIEKDKIVFRAIIPDIEKFNAKVQPGIKSFFDVRKTGTYRFENNWHILTRDNNVAAMAVYINNHIFVATISNYSTADDLNSLLKPASTPTKALKFTDQTAGAGYINLKDIKQLLNADIIAKCDGKFPQYIKTTVNDIDDQFIQAFPAIHLNHTLSAQKLSRFTATVEMANHDELKQLASCFIKGIDVSKSDSSVALNLNVDMEKLAPIIIKHTENLDSEKMSPELTKLLSNLHDQLKLFTTEDELKGYLTMLKTLSAAITLDINGNKDSLVKDITLDYEGADITDEKMAIVKAGITGFMMSVFKIMPSELMLLEKDKVTTLDNPLLQNLRLAYSSDRILLAQSDSDEAFTTMLKTAPRESDRTNMAEISISKSLINDIVTSNDIKRALPFTLKSTGLNLGIGINDDGVQMNIDFIQP